ncbi:hypothetical protein ACQ4PT_000232 [Festuca glaucescens]
MLSRFNVRSESSNPRKSIKESAPLLVKKPSTVPVVGDIKDVATPRGYAEAWEAFVRESERLWLIAAPITFNILCLYGVNSATQLFAGRLGNLQLSAAAVGLSVVSNFSFGFLLGMGSALETLCGQAYGAGHVGALLDHPRRLRPAALPALRLRHAHPARARPGRRHRGRRGGVHAAHPPADVLARAHLPHAEVPAGAEQGHGARVDQPRRALAAHVAMLYLFVSVLGWGLAGTAAAYDAFEGLWAFAKLSLASAVMLCLEIWYIMVLVVLTGHLDDAEIAVGSVSICMNLNGWEAMLFIGLNAAISVRVSNELGSGRPRAAKHAVVAVILQSLVIGLLAMAVILAYRNSFAVLFTADRGMQAAVGKVAYLLAVTMVLNSVQPVISGVAIGGGWQALVAYINLGCYYVLGLPLGFCLGYLLRLGPQGIWAGMLCGTALQTAILLVVIWKTDWEDEAAEANERISAWAGEKIQGGSGDDGDLKEAFRV